MAWGSGVGLAQRVGSHTTLLGGDGLFKAHGTRETLKGWVPPFTMRSAYEAETSLRRCPKGHQGLGAKGRRRSDPTYHCQKPSKGPVLPSLPTGLYRDGCPGKSEKRLPLASSRARSQ